MVGTKLLLSVSDTKDLSINNTTDDGGLDSELGFFLLHVPGSGLRLQGT